jgi:hypothetical protein
MTGPQLNSLSDEELYSLYREVLYDRFKTGFNFRCVRRDLAIEQRNKRERGEYMFVTRHTVLGRLKQIKETMFEMLHPEYTPEMKIDRSGIIKHLLTMQVRL